MIQLYRFALTALSFFCSFYLFAQTPSASVANWQGNKKAAVSVTLDDGCKAQFTIAQPIMDAHKINGTFFIITNLPQNCDGGESSHNAGTQAYTNDTIAYWNYLRNAITKGHEIGSHTLNILIWENWIQLKSLCRQGQTVWHTK